MLFLELLTYFLLQNYTCQKKILTEFKIIQQYNTNFNVFFAIISWKQLPKLSFRLNIQHVTSIICGCKSGIETFRPRMTPRGAEPFDDTFRKRYVDSVFVFVFLYLFILSSFVCLNFECLFYAIFSTLYVVPLEDPLILKPKNTCICYCIVVLSWK